MKNKTNKQTQKYTVLTNLVGCKIRGLMTEEQIAEYTATGKWTAAQIEEDN